MVSRLCDDGVQGRDGRCVENSSCFQIFLFGPVCILLLGSPAGIIFDTSSKKDFTGDFLVLELFLGDPIFDPSDFRDPLFKFCDRVSLNPGGRRVS